MIEPLSDFHGLRSNPQVMIKAKATPFILKKVEVQPSAERVQPEKTAKHLSEEEERMLTDLKLRDNSVREEEESHARMLGRHAGAIRYEYQIGPDGRAYVINGSVEVNPKFSSTDPDEIRKVLQTIQRAAVSVSNPSQADLNVAANAASKASVVTQKLAANKYHQGAENTPPPASWTASGGANTQLNVQA
jgi:hypothetical protein